MKLVPDWISRKRRERRIQRMSRRASMGVDLMRRGLLGAGLAAGAAATAQGAIPLWLRRPAASPFFTTVNSAASLQALLNTIRGAPATYAGKTIGILDGDYSAGGSGPSGRFDASGIAAASTVLFYGVGDRTAVLRGVDFSSSSNLQFQRVAFFEAFDTTPGSLTGVIVVGADISHPSTNCGVDDCELSSTPFSTMDFRYKVSGSGGAGSFSDGETLYTVSGAVQVPLSTSLAHGTYSATGSSGSTICFQIENGTGNGPTSTNANWNGKVLQNATGTAWRTLANPANISAPVKSVGTQGGVTVNILSGFFGFHSGFTFTNSYMHDVNRCFASNGINQKFNYNRCVDVYQNGGDHEGQFSGAEYQGNIVEHYWATHFDGSPGTIGPHTSLIGSSPSSNNVSNVLWKGNVCVPGFHRFDHPVTQGGGIWVTPSGPELNDQNNTWNAGAGISISGDVLTINTFTGGGGPSSISAGNRVMWGPNDTSGNVLSPADGLTILPFGTGGTTGVGTTGTYKLSASAGTVNTGVIIITSVNDGWEISSNLWQSGNGLGHEAAYGTNCKWLYNTLVTPLDAGASATPNFYTHDLYTGNLCSKNVVGGFTHRNPIDFLSYDFVTNSSDNVVALFAQASTSPASYYQMYNGKTGAVGAAKFQRLDAAGALEAFTPNPSGRIPSGYGHSAYYNFSTHVSNYPATPTPVSSNVASGISTTHVHADGTTFSRWTTAVSGANLLKMTTGNQFTIVLQFQRSNDSTSYYLSVGKNSAYKVLLNADGTITFSLNSTTTTTCVTGTTSFKVLVADGFTTVAFTVDVTNYKIYAIKGNFIDPMFALTGFTGDPMFLGPNGFNNATIGNNYTGTVSEFVGDWGGVVINDAFVDPSTPSGLAKFVAQDNNPVNYGSGAATLFGGTAARWAIGFADNDNVAAWNAGTNHGTSGTSATTGAYT